MAHNLPPQSCFLYESSWSPTVDSLLLGTIVKLKLANEWDDTTFPSHFIIEAGSSIERALGYAFDLAALYDRLHFLEKRYKTFKEVLQLEGTYWNPQTNVLIVVENVWTEKLIVSIVLILALVGAYFHYGDPAYNELAEMFAYDAVKVEREKTVIVLSDSPESCNNDFLFNKKIVHDHVHEAATHSEPGDHVRRKLMFEEGYPLDLESTNNKGSTYCVMGLDGKINKKLEKKPVLGSSSRPLKPRAPPNDTSYGCDSNSPMMWWRMPRKPM